MKRFNVKWSAAVTVALTIVACGQTPPEAPGTLRGSFAQIEGTVDDMHTNVAGKHYSGDLGDDQLGFAVTSFQKSVEGTPLAADAEKLARKVTEVSTLASKRPPIAKLRTSVKELKEVVAEIKQKL